MPFFILQFDFLVCLGHLVSFIELSSQFSKNQFWGEAWSSSSEEPQTNNGARHVYRSMCLYGLFPYGMHSIPWTVPWDVLWYVQVPWDLP